MRVLIGVTIRAGDLRFFKVISKLEPYQIELLESYIEEQIAQGAQDAAYQCVVNLTPELLEKIITLPE